MKESTQYIKKSRVLLMALAFMASAGCSKAPSEDVLKWAIGKQIPIAAIKMSGYEITNSYTRDINGETIYFYEYTAKLPSTSMNLKLALVERGNKWYMY